MGYRGHPFTWNNGSLDSQNIQERLDRCLANERLTTVWEGISVVHCARHESDHAPTSIGLEKVRVEGQRKKTRLFRFNEYMCSDQEFDRLVTWAWRDEGDNCGEKIQATQQGIQGYETVHGTLGKNIKELTEKLKKAEKWQSSAENVAKRKSMERELSELLKQEEVYWRQRSRAIWLKEGDKNTRFFHRKATQRQKVNRLKKMKDEHGEWVYGEEKLGQLMGKFFQELFSSSPTSNVEEVCAAIQHTLSNDGKLFLEERFTAAEVKQALFMMHPSKDPRPDGFSPRFFQRYWNVVGGDVTKFALDVLNEGVGPAGPL